MAIEVITTVTVAAGSYDLTDLATAKSELGVTGMADDDFLTRAIAQASRVIATYCNRVFPVETLSEIYYIRRDAFPRRPRGHSDPLQLTRWPVTTFTSAIEALDDGTTSTLVAGTDFRLNTDRGQLFRLNADGDLAPRWEPMTLTVVYAAGYAAIPDDLVDAALRLVTARYRAKSRDPMLKSMTSPSVGTETYWVTPPGQSNALGAEIIDLIDQYRVPKV